MRGGDERPAEPAPAKLAAPITSGPCNFSPPPAPGTPSNRTFTIKLPNGTNRADFALATAGGVLTVTDAVLVVDDAGGYASVSSVEATNRLWLGPSSKAQHAFSELTGIEVRSQAHLYGNAKTASTVIRHAGSIVDGTTTQNTSLRPLATTSWTVAFPGNTRGNCSLDPDKTQIIDPGTYGNITIKARSHLKLRSGTYYFRSLALDADSLLDADNVAGPVYVYIRDSFSFNGAIVPADATKANVLVGYAGTSAVDVQRSFRGILVAPNATVTLAPTGSTGHTGSFFAKSLTAQASTTIHHRPFSPASFCPGEAACSILCPCSPGGTCQTNADCQAGLLCTAGTCQPPNIDDGNPCTADSIDGNGNVLHAPLPAGTSCADINVCNGDEVCNATAQCLAGTPPALDDGNPCTADACTAAGGITHTPVPSGTSCSNGNACDGAETCDAAGACTAGTPPVLDDGNPCTADTCDAETGVAHTPLPAGTSCADTNVCNGVEACSAAGVCEAGTAPVLDDGNACTADSCDPTTGIQHDPVPAGTSCADADLCNGGEACNDSAECIAGSPSQVDDNNPCTMDACDPILGVTHIPVAPGTSCDDGNLCNGTSTCNPGAVCVAGDPPVVDDGNPCTADSCNPATGVTHTPVAQGTSCSDSNACNGEETCNGGGVCVPGGAPPIDDQNPCTADSCDPSSGVTHTPLPAGTTCADSDQCNGAEACNGSGTCTSGAPPDVDDQNPCTADACDPASGVTHTPVASGTSCADSDLCNGEETCNSTGMCTPGTPPDVDDQNPCTSDSCVPAEGVQHIPVTAGTSCADTDVCNGAETCNGIGNCDAGAPLETDDQNPCTADTCDPANGVSHTPVAAGTACADADVCNGAETCNATGTCSPGTPLTVDDANPCTVDSCDPAAGVQHAPVPAGTSCADGNACNGDETCSAIAQCQAGVPIAVDDNQPCTADACDPATGEVTHIPEPPGASCDAIDACHDAGTCTASGACTAGPPLEVDDGDPCTIELCDPENGITQHSCTAIDPTVATVFADANAWIYSGANPLQTGVAAGTIDRERAILLKGHVTDREGLPIPNVAVTVLNHPELGSTLTHFNGDFVMVVNGGSQLVVQFRGEGYLSADRTAEARVWSDDILLPEVVLLAPDPVVTAIDLDDASVDFQVAQGSIITDDSGTRQGTLLFPAGTEATMELPDGNLVPISSLSVRATEFTTGALGFNAMPGSLPPDSAYTYAFELNADEAVEAGSPEITFSNPLVYYVENFLGFPAGTNVPVGSYDRARGAWAAEPNGRVIQIVSISGGAAQVNIDANPAPESSAQLAAFGITPAEQEQLAALYATGTSLWRIPIAHFTSPWDANWSFSPQTTQRPPTGALPRGIHPSPAVARAAVVLRERVRPQTVTRMHRSSNARRRSWARRFRSPELHGRSTTRAAASPVERQPTSCTFRSPAPRCQPASSAPRSPSRSLAASSTTSSPMRRTSPWTSPGMAWTLSEESSMGRKSST